MKERSKADDIHTNSIQAREKEQDFLKALLLSDEALVAYGEDNDAEGIAGIYGTRQNIFNHLYEHTHNENYLLLAQHAAETAVEIAERNSISEMTLPYRDLAKACEKLEDYVNAVSHYKKALSFKDSPSLARPAVESDLKAHLGFTIIMSGDKDAGVQTLNDAISELESDTKANKYEHDVWLSGAYMRKALAMKDTESLEKAKTIIESNPELVLRRKQLEELASKFDK